MTDFKEGTFGRKIWSKTLLDKKMMLVGNIEMNDLRIILRDFQVFSPCN